MTPTAKELWNDKEFLENRFWEQIQYLRDLSQRNLSLERYNELRKSAIFIGNRFGDRMRELDYWVNEEIIERASSLNGKA